MFLHEENIKQISKVISAPEKENRQQPCFSLHKCNTHRPLRPWQMASAICHRLEGRQTLAGRPHALPGVLNTLMLEP